MASKRKKKNDNKKAFSFIFLCGLFVIILISTVFSDWVQIINNKKQTRELLTEQDLLLEEEASLKSEVTKLQDPDYIARYAREKYMYTKDGEVILKIIDESSEQK